MDERTRGMGGVQASSPKPRTLSLSLRESQLEYAPHPVPHPHLLTMSWRQASCGEENLLGLDVDPRYRGRDILSHEFAHTLMGARHRVAQRPSCAAPICRWRSRAQMQSAAASEICERDACADAARAPWHASRAQTSAFPRPRAVPSRRPTNDRWASTDGGGGRTAPRHTLQPTPTNTLRS